MRLSPNRSFWMRWSVLLSIIIVIGCGGYGDVSPTTYEYAKALFSICSRRSPVTLDHITEQIDESLDQQEITEREAGWLRQIIDEARAGDWEKALSRSRRMMEDQVKGR